MILSSIVAMGKNRVIGKNNQMIWSIPSESRHYKSLRGDHYFLIGRKNYEGSASILDKERALVLTRQVDFECPASVFQNFKDAVTYAKDKGETELFVLGGEEIYRLMMPYIHRLYLSVVDFEESGDAYFPSHEEYDWIKTEHFEKTKGPDTPLSWTFFKLEKTPKPIFTD